MTYEYLPKCAKKNKDGVIDLRNTNYFIKLTARVITEAESPLGYAFPSELRKFYEEIGFGYLTTPENPPKEYHFLSSNLILHPKAAAGFSRGELLFEDLGCGMLPDIFELLSPGDLPVFEIGDSSSFMIMKPMSDNPNAVYFDDGLKVEDSFERFIWRLYYESPSYYGKISEESMK
jgi:hypothetical protein